jgi:hypothetical protein
VIRKKQGELQPDDIITLNSGRLAKVVSSSPFVLRVSLRAGVWGEPVKMLDDHGRLWNVQENTVDMV